ncbi:hypothetical protein BRAS3809_5310008 [Bradyrhizobium sp. STM 3809]|nr:hypothetical protein BRAS3809_5310008 [Bradyrhizobium sp. STM 3809]
MCGLTRVLAWCQFASISHHVWRPCLRLMLPNNGFQYNRPIQMGWRISPKYYSCVKLS